MAESANNTIITPGVGTITDAGAIKWTITPAGTVQKNIVNVPGGTGTDKLAYVTKNIWGHDATHTPATGWYELVGVSWIGPSANVVGGAPPVTQPPVTQPPVTQPPVTQPPVNQPPVVLNDTLTIIIAGVSTSNVNPKFIVSLGSNGDIVVPPTAVIQVADNVNWQTFTFQGNWSSPQVGYLTFVNAAPNRELVVKSIGFDANTYSSNNVIVLSQQGQSASFQR